MRLPRIKQLTDEQKKVYLYAPTDRHVLVSGPPGTGKTLIACLRAIELKKKNVPVMLGMFNRVLAKYSSNVGEIGEMPSQTVLVWFRDWWKRSELPPHPNTPGGIIIQAPFDQNHKIRAAGARWQPNEWRPWGGGKGVWSIEPETYFHDPDSFMGWSLWHSPPAVDGKSNKIDWQEVARHLLSHEDSIPDAALDLGTLLIDEGQDFPPGFYKTLRHISSVAAARGNVIPYPPRCFVLADENQQLTEENSTLQQIAGALAINAEYRYQLLDNFRNSKEIAELARSFFADVGVLPRVPERPSEKPVYAQVAGRTEIVNRIKIWLTNNPGKEVGVFVFNEDARTAMVAELQGSLGRMRGRNITIQTYSWKSRRENKAEKLLFDIPDVITVLNMQSCKGLEFDAVFIVDLHEAQIGLYGTDRFKMQMFVAVSRARDWVSLIDSGRRAGSGSYYNCLPGPDFLEREGGQLAASAGQSPPPADLPNRAAQSADDRSGSSAVEMVGRVDWKIALAKLSKKLALQVNDRRAKGGAVWVNGGTELSRHLEPLGFTHSEKRSGWWRK